MLVKAFAEDNQLKFRSHQVEGPASPRDYLDWNARLRKWRLEQQNDKKESHVTAGYDIPELQVEYFPFYASICQIKLICFRVVS